MTTTLKLWAGILIACFIMCSNSLASTLRGTVRSSLDLSPLSKAAVTVDVLIPDSISYPAVADSDGKYLITGIVPGNEIYVVRGYHTGFKGSYTRIDDLGSRDLVFDIVLDPDTTTTPPGGGDSSSVGGRILESPDGGTLLPVPDALLTFTSPAGNATASSNGEGNYFVKVRPGSYSITVIAPGFDSLSMKSVEIDTTGTHVNAVLRRTAVAVKDAESPEPASFRLSRAYPNPFNPTTTLTFAVGQSCTVRLTVYDITGRAIASLVNSQLEPGVHSAVFDATGLASGMYIIRMDAATSSGRLLFSSSTRAALIR